MSTHGVKLIHAALQDAGLDKFYSIPVELLNEAERERYAYLERFLTRYGRFPSQEALREAGYTTPSIVDGFEYHFDKVLNRQRVNITSELIAELANQNMGNNGEDALGVIQQAADRLNELDNTVLGLSNVPWYQQFKQEINDRFTNLVTNRTVPTGWEPLDMLEHGGGFRNGELYVIVGRPKIGKTHILGAVAMHAWNAGHKVDYISMEMGEAPIRTMLASQELKVSEHVLRQPLLPTPFLQVINNHIDSIQDRPAFNVFSAGIGATPLSITPTLRRTNADAVYIDAVYRMQPDKPERDRYKALSSLVEDLKSLAIKLNRPVIVTAQYGRKDEERVDGNTNNDNIEGTDKFKQEAAMIIGINSRYAGPGYDYRVLAVSDTNRYGAMVSPFKIRFNLGQYAEDNFRYLGEFEPSTAANEAPAPAATANPFYLASVEAQSRRGR